MVSIGTCSPGKSPSGQGDSTQGSRPRWRMQDPQLGQAGLDDVWAGPKTGARAPHRGSLNAEAQLDSDTNSTCTATGAWTIIWATAAPGATGSTAVKSGHPVPSDLLAGASEGLGDGAVVMGTFPEHRARLPWLREDDPPVEGSRHGGAHEGAARIPQPVHDGRVEHTFVLVGKADSVSRSAGVNRSRPGDLARRAQCALRVVPALDHRDRPTSRSLLQNTSKLRYFEACRRRFRGCSSSVRASGDW